MAGKTGADAIFVALHHICRTLNAYRSKANALIDAAVAASVITSAQGTTAKDFIAGASALCDIFALLAGFNSV